MRWLTMGIIQLLAVYIFTACGSGDGATGGNGTNPPIDEDLNNDPPVTTVEGWNPVNRISMSRDSFNYDLLLPKVAMNDDGLAVAVWVEEFNGTLNDYPSIWSNIITNGVSGTPYKITTSTSTTPSVAVSDNGNAVVVFDRMGMDGGGISSRSIWARHFRNGIWESDEVPISGLPADDYTFYAFSPDVAIDENGNAIAVWLQSDSTAKNPLSIVYASYFDGISWSAPVVINDATTNAFPPKVAMNDQGTAVVVWSEYTNPYDSSNPNNQIPNVWARVYINGVWLDQEKIGTLDLHTFDGTEREQVAINGNNQAIAVWEEVRNLNFNIVESRYDPNNGSWSTANSIATSSDYLSYPNVTLTDAGDAAVIWEAQVDSSREGIIRYYDFSSDTWLTSEPYENEVTNVSYARVDSDANNSIYVSWLQFIDGSMMSQFVSQYSADNGWTNFGAVSRGYLSNMRSNDPGNIIVVNINADGLFNDAAFSTYYIPPFQ